MSERLFKVLLAELDKVRLTCPHCQVVTEMTVKQMGSRFARSADCLVCGKEFTDKNPQTGATAIERLADAIRDLQADPRGVRVEFVLPDPSGD